MTWLLILGLLPSMTGLSRAYLDAFPSLGSVTGPINIVKLLIPFLIYFIWKNRASVSRRTWIVLAVWSIGLSICLIPQWIACDRPSSLLRELATTLIGSWVALAFFMATKAQRVRIAWGWVAIVFGGVLIQYLLPSLFEWITNNIFDPGMNPTEFEESGPDVLKGFHGRQSLAKLMIWVPWILLAVSESRRSISFAIPLILVSSALSLATTQRAALLAGVIAAVSALLHFVIRSGKKIYLVYGGVGLLMVCLGASIIVPRSIWYPRLAPLLGLEVPSEYQSLEGPAKDSLFLRKQLMRMNAERLSSRPLGDACPSVHDYLSYGINPAHSHHMFVEQFRIRGWLWGWVSLFFWLWSFMSAWKMRDVSGTAWVGVVTSVIVMGQFDNPWGVITHSIVLSIALFVPIWIKAHEE